MSTLLSHIDYCLGSGFREIAALVSNPRKEQRLPGFYLQHWLLFATSIFFLYGQLLAEHLAVYFVLRHHAFISFCGMIAGVISFVLSLKKGFYKY